MVVSVESGSVEQRGKMAHFYMCRKERERERNEEIEKSSLEKYWRGCLLMLCAQELSLSGSQVSQPSACVCVYVYGN